MIPRNEKIFILEQKGYNSSSNTTYSEEEFDKFLDFLINSCGFTFAGWLGKKLNVCPRGKVITDSNFYLEGDYSYQGTLYACNDSCGCQADVGLEKIGRPRPLSSKMTLILKLKKNFMFLENSDHKCTCHIQYFLNIKALFGREKPILSNKIKKNECCPDEENNHIKREERCVKKVNDGEFHLTVWEPNRRMRRRNILTIMNLHCEPPLLSWKGLWWHFLAFLSTESHAKQRTHELFEYFKNYLNQTDFIFQ